jgi:hypothetical protein
MEILQRPKHRNGRKFGETSQFVARRTHQRCDVRHTAYVRFSRLVSATVAPAPFGKLQGQALAGSPAGRWRKRVARYYRAGAGAGVACGAGVLKSTFGV